MGSCFFIYPAPRKPRLLFHCSLSETAKQSDTSGNPDKKYGGLARG